MLNDFSYIAYGKYLCHLVVKLLILLVFLSVTIKNKVAKPAYSKFSFLSYELDAKACAVLLLVKAVIGSDVWHLILN